MLRWVNSKHLNTMSSKCISSMTSWSLIIYVSMSRAVLHHYLKNKIYANFQHEGHHFRKLIRASPPELTSLLHVLPLPPPFFLPSLSKSDPHIPLPSPVNEFHHAASVCAGVCVCRCVCKEEAATWLLHQFQISKNRRKQKNNCMWRRKSPKQQMRHNNTALDMITWHRLHKLTLQELREILFSASSVPKDQFESESRFILELLVIVQ